MNQKTVNWLAKHQISLEESFPDTLRKLSRRYQREKGFRYLDDVYRLLGARKESLYYWKNHPYSTQTKKF